MSPAAGFTLDLLSDRLKRCLPKLSTSVPEQNGVRGAGRPLAALPPDPVDSPLAPAKLAPMPERKFLSVPSPCCHG